jgi:hypothetical protein
MVILRGRQLRDTMLFNNRLTVTPPTLQRSFWRAAQRKPNARSYGARTFRAESGEQGRVDLFTDDAAIHTPVGDRQGRAGILEWIEGRLALRAPDYQVGHHMLNSLVTRSSPNSVKVRSMFLYTRQRRDGCGNAELLGAGIYEDGARKEPAGWRFSYRRFSFAAPLDDAFFRDSDRA